MAKPEPDRIYLLRHRWARTIEVWVAYQTFLHKQVLVGLDKICMDDAIVEQTTHTLLVVYYSYIYSLFDSSGTNFEFITAEYISDFSREMIEVRDLILDHWQKIQNPIKRIRHNIGFHQAGKRKGSSIGYKSYIELHPLSSEYLMTLLRVFFRLLGDVYDYEEPYMNKPSNDDTDALYNWALELKQLIDHNSQEDLIKVVVELFKDLSEENNT